MGKSNDTKNLAGPAAAKIQPPRPSLALPRERLYARLDAGRTHAATWVFGPPGAGKTTLAASWLRARKLRFLWYQLDEGDADPASFFHYLGLAAAQLDGRRSNLLPRFSPAAAMTPGAFAREFFRGLFAAHPELVLAFDNCQDLPGESGVAELLQLACGEAPAGGGVVLMSRQPPPACFARARLDGALQVIGPTELGATAEEVAQLADTLGTKLGRDDVQALQERTGGWMAGVRVTLELGAAAAPARPPAALEDYFAQEVLRTVAPETQDVLLRTALLPVVTRAGAAALAGPGALAAIAELARENYFTTAHGGDEPAYRFHPMFHEFLARRARERLGGTALKELVEAGARALEGEGRWEDAAVALMEAELAAPLSELIKRHAAELVQSARFGTLAAWICRLPEAMVATDPWLNYWLGECLLWLEPPRAEPLYETAYALFGRERDVGGQALAGAGALYAIFNVMSDFARMDPWIGRMSALFAEHGGALAPEVQGRLTFSMLVALSFHQADHPEMEAWFARARALAQHAPDPTLRAFLRLHMAIHRIWTGDLPGAEDELRVMDRECSQELKHLAVRANYDLAWSSVAIFRGDIGQCIASATEGLRQSERGGIPLWDDTLLGQCATAHISVGALDAAAPLLARMERIVARSPPRSAHYHQVMTLYELERGDPEAAGREAQLAVASAQSLGITSAFQALARQCAAAASLCRRDAAGAAPHLEAANALARRPPHSQSQWFNRLLAAYSALVRGKAEEADAAVAPAFADGARHGFTHYMIWPRGMIAELCAHALEAGIEPEYARGLVRRWKLAPPARARALEAWPWELRVRALGGFAVEVSGKALHFEGKAQHMPLEFLKALIAFGGERVPETRLMDALWPDSEGAAAQQALSTTLFRLRKLVGEGVVTRQEGRIGLDPARCWVDALALMREPGEGQAGNGVPCERLLALYAGPFLAGEEDCPWALPLRERLHARVARGIDQRARELAAGGRHAEALALYERGIEVDELVEGYYCGIMSCQRALGLASDALRTYRRCEAVLRARLGVEPSAATRRLHAEIAGRSG